MNRESMGFIAVAMGFVLLAALVAWLQKKTLREVLGFESKKAWWYRDLALGTVASMATMIALAMAYEATLPDLGVAIVCAIIAIGCCEISPNRLILYGASVGVVAIQSWIGFVFHGPRALWVAVPATLIVIVILLAFGKRPVVER